MKDVVLKLVINVMPKLFLDSVELIAISTKLNNCRYSGD